LFIDCRKNIPDETTGRPMGGRIGGGDEEGPRTFFNKNANANSNLARLMVRNGEESP
jgi:hypothetical protein